MAPRPALIRLIERPLLSDWSVDELISFSEAAALFFPKGPLSANSLRIAQKDGILATVQICGKRFTSIGAMMALMRTSNIDKKSTKLDDQIAEAENKMVERFREALSSGSTHKGPLKTVRPRVPSGHRGRIGGKDHI